MALGVSFGVGLGVGLLDGVGIREGRAAGGREVTRLVEGLVAGRSPKVSTPVGGRSEGATSQSVQCVYPGSFSHTFAAATTSTVSTIDITTMATFSFSARLTAHLPRKS